jgi:hypothetical protein
MFYISVNIDVLTLYGPSGHLMDPNILALKADFKVTTMEQPY